MVSSPELVSRTSKFDILAIYKHLQIINVIDSRLEICRPV